MKIIQSLCALLLIVATLSAQEKNSIKTSKVSAADFVLPASSAIDSNAHAVILSDIGIIEFVGNKKGWFSYVFHRKTRIKLLTKKAFDLATVKIPLYVHEDDKEELGEWSASTYNLENGQLIETKMGRNEIFNTVIDKNHVEQKFTLPAIKEGAIIEYSYTITSNFIFNLPPWEFQNINYPCLWSEYQVTIPSALIYIFDKRGVHPFFIDKASEGNNTYLVTQPIDRGSLVGIEERPLSVNASTIKHRWVMKDIPAFFVENYLSAPVNYIDKIEFQLHQTNNGETTSYVMNTWKKATDELLKSEDFGAALENETNEYWLDKALAGIVKDNTAGQLQQAKDIYYYISGNFNCTSHYNRHITTTLQDVYKKHNGNVGELNLLLVAMLQRKHISAAPVLLSTREFGYNYPGYPIMDRLNYVICRAVADGQVFFLDASHASLGFGILPGNCYNGHARIISRTDSASIYFMPDSLRERKLTIINIRDDEKNKGAFRGSFESHLGPLESYGLREAVAAKGEQRVLNELKNKFNGEAELSDISIDSLKLLEQPVKLKGEFVLKTGNADMLYFSPMLWNRYASNPFTMADRKYPVEMNYPLNETYMLTVTIPEGYEVDELPRMSRILYNEGEGLFEYLLQKSEDVIQLRCTLRFKKAYFDADEYNTLRAFFGNIVKKQSEQLVFKRKK